MKSERRSEDEGNAEKRHKAPNFSDEQILYCGITPNRLYLPFVVTPKHQKVRDYSVMVNHPRR